MSKVDELIEALMEVYFEEENTCERYKIFEKVEKAMKEARSVTHEQIENLEDFRSQFPDLPESDVVVLAYMSKIVANAAVLDEVVLTRETTVGEILKMGDIDSLDIVELIMMFEEYLDVDIEADSSGNVDPQVTIGDILDLRK